MIDQAVNAHRLRIFSKQRQSACAVSDFVARRQLERQHRLRRPHRTLQVNRPVGERVPPSSER